MLLVAVCLLLIYFLYHHLLGKRRGLPPGPTPLPIFGNLLQIDPIYPERSIERWSRQYGGLMTLWLPRKVICLADFELIREYCIKKSDLFAGRPSSFISGLLTDNFAGLIFSFGERWREQRRFAINTLRNFGFGRKIMEQKVMLEAKLLEEEIKTMQGAPFDPSDMVELAISNVIANILIGHRHSLSEPRYQRFKHFNEQLMRKQSPLASAVDALPSLRFLPACRTALQPLVDARRGINGVIAEYIQEHKDRFDPAKEAEDFVNAYLGEIHRRRMAGEDAGYFSEHQLIIATTDLMSAGMETSLTTLRWGILFLIHNPRVQEMAQRELDGVIGADAEVSMADRSRLPYNCAVVQEIQRKANILPINLFRTNTQDVTMNGHLIKKGTEILPSISNVMTNARVFREPERFDPTRFLNHDGSSKKVEELVPFSVGKRQCLGESLARMELFLFCTTLLQRFRFSPPPDGLPSLDPVNAFVRKPATFQCIAVERQ